MSEQYMSDAFAKKIENRLKNLTKAVEQVREVVSDDYYSLPAGIRDEVFWRLEETRTNMVDLIIAADDIDLARAELAKAEGKRNSAERENA